MTKRNVVAIAAWVLTLCLTARVLFDWLALSSIPFQRRSRMQGSLRSLGTGVLTETTADKQGIQLTGASSATVDFRLEVGQVTSVVEVSSAGHRAGPDCLQR